MAAVRPSDGLFEQVAAYNAEAVSAVSEEGLSAPTPCSHWDLLTLLLHMDASLGTLIEVLEDGRPGLAGRRRRSGSRRTQAADLLAADDTGTLLAAALKYRIERLVSVHDAIRRGDGPDTVLIGGHPLPYDLVAAAGAVEIAVHSWDIAQACGRTLPIPDAPAAELLDLSALILDGAGRPGLFASAVPVPAHTGPGDRLIARLGRTPPPRPAPGPG